MLTKQTLQSRILPLPLTHMHCAGSRQEASTTDCPHQTYVASYDGSQRGGGGPWHISEEWRGCSSRWERRRETWGDRCDILPIQGVWTHRLDALLEVQPRVNNWEVQPRVNNLGEYIGFSRGIVVHPTYTMHWGDSKSGYLELHCKFV